MHAAPDQSSDLLFPPGSLARVIARRPSIVAIAGGRAIVMQLAHPLVAAGIDEHSSFKTDPVGRTIQTAEAFRRFFWHTKDRVDEVVPKIRAQHAKVRGDGYSAEDPELLLWVHATTVDSLMVAYEFFVRRLGEQERASYCDEAKVIAELLGCPATRQPDTLRAFDGYVETAVATLEPSATSRSLTHDFLFFPRASLGPAARRDVPTRHRWTDTASPAPELGIPWGVAHRASWAGVRLIASILRLVRQRREPPDPATMRREGRCARCSAEGTIGARGMCMACSRALGDERLARSRTTGPTDRPRRRFDDVRLAGERTRGYPAPTSLSAKSA